MIKCDYCEKPAVRNYQRIWVSWVITGKGYSKNGRVEESRKEIEPGKSITKNIHVCREHEKKFIAENLSYGKN